jgi:soluble lytic murein transglycosylase-like protein
MEVSMNMTNEYDPMIRGSAERWLDGIAGTPWLQWKAQLIAESGLDPTAGSNEGARGIAQIMPNTWQMICIRLQWPMDTDPYDARYGIDGGAWYLGQLYQAWKSPRTGWDRLDLARASYNAGIGNILKAQRLSGGALGAAEILSQLEGVTGESNAAQTLTYVQRCKQIYEELVT